ncbi:histidine phosphatase family protein [Amnibacterium endophyticum]|uniref:Histidine phosphatase family protein n=1 Tax=Amnibacterium endophyticum TaxID=2109337 RepID=A0ABW4LF05_9MICO
MACIFITHPEVLIDPGVPVVEWGLSSVGKDRATRLPDQVGSGVELVVSSGERKAVETADLLAAARGLPRVVDHALGEMDRSATGYLPPAEFEQTADAFFAHPELSVRGWERAVDAQSRVEAAVRRHQGESDDRAIAFVAHGGVGGLLMASLAAVPISRSLDQPGLGSYFWFDAQNWKLLSPWHSIS